MFDVPENTRSYQHHSASIFPSQHQLPRGPGTVSLFSCVQWRGKPSTVNGESAGLQEAPVQGEHLEALATAKSRGHG